MLLDPRWDVFTFFSLVAWLETKDPNTKYNFTDPTTCLVAHYLKEKGVEKYCLDGDELDEALPGLTQLVQHNGDQNQDWTYGGALRRARQLTSRL